MVHYPVDVQPMLEKHCLKCHSGENAKGRLDLADEPTDLFSRTFELLVGRRLISYRNVGFGRSQYRPQDPLSDGSHLSKMVERIQTGDPCKAKLSREEFIRFVTWIDANAPYYGTYRGKRDLKYKDDPDFRLPPLASRRSP